MVYALNWPPATGIAGRGAVIVPTYAARQVVGDAGIQGAVATQENVEKPGAVFSGALFFKRIQGREILTKKNTNIKPILIKANELLC